MMRTNLNIATIDNNFDKLDLSLKFIYLNYNDINRVLA